MRRSAVPPPAIPAVMADWHIERLAKDVLPAPGVGRVASRADPAGVVAGLEVG